MKLNTLIISLAISLSFPMIPIVGLARDGFPKPNNKGDFFDGAWREWLVVDLDPKGLNCRSGAGTNYSVIKTFPSGNRIYVFTQGVEPLIKRDRQGKPWLAALPNGYQYDPPCFVRANNRFIQPIPYE